MAKARLIPESGPLSLPLELGEDLSAGDPIYVYDDAGTAKIKKCVSNTTNKSSYGKGYYNVGCMVETVARKNFVVVYRDLNNSSYVYVRAGQIATDNTITWGTAVQVYAGAAYYLDVCSYASGYFCVTFRGTSNVAQVRAGSVGATNLSISMGSAVNASVGACYYNQICSPAPNKICVICKDAGTSNYTIAVAGTIVTHTITLGSQVTLDTLSASYLGICSPATDKIAATYYGSSKGYAIGATISGTTITPGTRSEFNSGAVYSTYVKSPSTDKVVVAYRNAADGYKPYARCATLSGTAFTWGTALKLLDSTSYYQSIGILGTSDIVFNITKDLSPYKAMSIKASISGTTLSLEPAETYYADRAYYIDCLGVSSTRYALIWYATIDAVSYALVVEGELNSIPKCLGLLEEAGSLGETKECRPVNSISESMSSLSIGQEYFIQDNGSITTATSSYPIALAYDTNKLFLSKTLIGE